VLIYLFPRRSRLAHINDDVPDVIFRRATFNLKVADSYPAAAAAESNFIAGRNCLISVSRSWENISLNPELQEIHAARTHLRSHNSILKQVLTPIAV